MKMLLRAAGALVFLLLLFLVGSLLYSTARGYTQWYFRVSGQVIVNGEKTTGYMHANTKRNLLLLTTTDDPQPETYLIALGPEKTVFDCGDWHPVRFLPFPVGNK